MTISMLAVHEDRLAAAVARLGSENAFEILRGRASSKRRGRRVVHMEIGEPDFDTPEYIKKAAVDALYDNHTHYTPSARPAVAARSRSREYASRFRHMTPPWSPRRTSSSRPGAKPDHLEHVERAARPGRRVRLLRSRLSRVRIVRELLAGKRPRDSACASRATGGWISTSSRDPVSSKKTKADRHQLAAQSDRRRADQERPRVHRRACRTSRLPRSRRRNL